MTDHSLTAALQDLIKRTADSILRHAKGDRDRVDVERSLEKELFHLGNATALRKCFEEYKSTTLEARIRHRSKNRDGLDQNWARNEAELLVLRLLSEAEDGRLRRVPVNDPDEWRPTASFPAGPALKELLDQAVEGNVIATEGGLAEIAGEVRGICARAPTLTPVRDELREIRKRAPEQPANATNQAAHVQLKVIDFVEEVVGIPERPGASSIPDRADDAQRVFGLPTRPGWVRETDKEWAEAIRHAIRYHKLPPDEKTAWERVKETSTEVADQRPEPSEDDLREVVNRYVEDVLAACRALPVDPDCDHCPPKCDCDRGGLDWEIANEIAQKLRKRLENEGIRWLWGDRFKHPFAPSDVARTLLELAAKKYGAPFFSRRARKPS